MPSQVRDSANGVVSRKLTGSRSLREGAVPLNIAHALARPSENPHHTSAACCPCRQAQTELTLRHYKGLPAMNELLGRQVDVMCEQIANTISAGKGHGLRPSRRTPGSRA